MARVNVSKSHGKLPSPPSCGTALPRNVLEHMISVAMCFWSCVAKALSFMTRQWLRRPWNHFAQ
eukprot:2844621-Alexandrium_andersonii.AAC.1